MMNEFHFNVYAYMNELNCKTERMDYKNNLQSTLHNQFSAGINWLLYMFARAYQIDCHIGLKAELMFKLETSLIHLISVRLMGSLLLLRDNVWTGNTISEWQRDSITIHTFNSEKWLRLTLTHFIT